MAEEERQPAPVIAAEAETEFQSIKLNDMKLKEKVVQEIVDFLPEPGVLKAEDVSSSVQSDHKRKLEDLDHNEKDEIQLESVDWNSMSIEVQHLIPDEKRPRLDDVSDYTFAFENIEQISEDNLEAGNPQEPSIGNFRTTDCDDSSVGDSQRDEGDLSFEQKHLLSDDQTMSSEMDRPNEKDDIKEKRIIEDENVGNTLVNNVEVPLSVSAKVDLTKCFHTDQVFDSREALIEWCQEVGRKNKSVIVISKSRKQVQGRAARLELGCERGGVYRDHKKKAQQLENKYLTRRRESGTRKCGCPFKLKGVCMVGEKWKVKVHCGEHNHELPESLVGHSYVARLKDEEKQILVHLTKSGLRPRQVLNTLKERSKENMSTMRTIYNARATLRLMETEGKSDMEQVMKLLSKHHYIEWHRRDEENEELRDIFWAHPESIQLVRCFHSVLMVDCTYKTNRFGTPLFQIVGMTSIGKPFTVAFVFLEAETKDHYTWALTRLKTLFPPSKLPTIFVTDGELALVNAIGAVFPLAERLLCKFHISNNVSENCRNHFENNEEFEQFMQEWTNLMEVETKERYMDVICDFLLKWASYPLCLNYIRESWLPHKEQFVSAWTNNVKHFGHTTANRTESSYVKLKSHLGSSVNNFSTCWTAMHQMICNEIIDIKASFEKTATLVQQEHLLLAFKELWGKVSPKALELLAMEHSRSENVGTDVTACGCALRSSHGLPCAHEISQFCRMGSPIPLSKIDSHWKQLSATPMPEELNEFYYLPELLLIRERWEKASETERKTILEMLEKIATPTTSSLLVPHNGVPS